jgi:hypothetical protein
MIGRGTNLYVIDSNEPHPHTARIRRQQDRRWRSRGASGFRRQGALENAIDAGAKTIRIETNLAASA